MKPTTPKSLSCLKSLFCRSSFLVTCLGISALFLPAVAQAATLAVPAQYATIQAGINAAQNGDTVLVADGTYTGPGNVDIDFNGKNITVTSQHGAASTTIDCGSSIHGSLSPQHRGFYVHRGETSAVISGLTIKNGYTVVTSGVPDSGNGGGVCFHNSNASVQSCILSNNTAQYGGGVYNYNNTGSDVATLTNCTIVNNTALYMNCQGGGVYNANTQGGVMALTNCMISGNDAGGDTSVGGGILNAGSSSSAPGSGKLSLTNCIVAANAADGNGSLGGGIANEGSAILINCTVTANLVPSPAGSGLVNFGSLTLTNDILYGNIGEDFVDYGNPAPTISYCDIGSAYTGASGSSSIAGTADISANPIFVNAPDDLHLQPHSVCLSAGTTAGAPNTTLDGRTRPNPPSLGAYESEPAPISGSDDIFVSTGFDGTANMIEEYTSVGQHIRSIAVPSNTGAYAANGTEYLRGIAVNDAGQIIGFNGTFSPELTVFSPLTYTFASRTDANWSISNNASSGSIGAYQGYAFVLTDTSSSPSTSGIIRFNPDGTSQHFGENPNNSKNYLNLTVGLNGKLYVLYSNLSNAFLADVYDPVSLQLLQTITFQLPSDHNGAATELRNLAVDVFGGIYTVDLNTYIYHLDAQGNLLQSATHAQSGYTSDIKIDPLSGAVFISISGYGGQVLQTDASLSSFQTVIQLDPNQFESDFITFGNAKSAAALNSQSDVLWNSADGQVQVRAVNPDGTQTTLGTFGPYTDSGDQGIPGNTALWKAIAVARVPDGTLRLLWQHPDGRVMLWRLDASGTPLSITGYGPYTDTGNQGVPGNTSVWQAVGLSVSTDGLTHLLWDHPDGRAMLWNVNADDTFSVIGGYGPYDDSGDVGVPGNTAVWHTTALANAPDGSFRLVWNHPDGRVMLWDVSGTGTLVSLGGYGPYTDSGDTGVPGNTALWKAVAVQVSADSQAHLLWDHPDGRAMLWTVDDSYNIAGLTGYGPYTDAPISSSLWQALGLALTPSGLPYVLWNNPDGRTVLWNIAADGTVNYSGIFEATSDSASQAWVPTALSGN